MEQTHANRLSALLIGTLIATFLLAMPLFPVPGIQADAFAAESSAAERAEQYAQQDPGYAPALEGSGSTMYYLDLEEPEKTSSTVPVNGSTLPKTGDDIFEKSLAACITLIIIAVIAILVTVIPTRRSKDSNADDHDRIL